MGIFRWVGPLDDDAQPPAVFNTRRRSDRNLSEMLGLVKGVLADGSVTRAEADLLQQWVAIHPDTVATWPASQLHQRLVKVFDDNHVSAEELEDLQELLTMLVGGSAGILDDQDASTDLPLDRPPPEIVFQEKSFCLTGKFALGPRKACEEVVAALGGKCTAGVNKSTDYVVIGTFGSRDWIQTSHGRKIEKAMEFKQEGLKLFIVSEEHWVKALPTE